jgi:hypothetical protein
MTDHHPITPPPELVQQWASESLATQNLCNRASQWGDEQRGEVNESKLQQARDQELEACLDVLKSLHLPHGYITELRSARRPKPPSLKEQAQAELKRLIALIPTEGAIAMAEPIRRALEALSDE